MVTTGTIDRTRQLRRLNRGRLVILATLACQGFAIAINGVAAPWMMRSFGVDEASIARAFGWISLSALGAFALARRADRVGRRPIVIGSLLAGSVASLGAALAHSLVSYILLDIVALSAAGAATACSVVWIAEASAEEDRAAGQGLAGLALVLGSGPCVLLMPWLARTAISWRALLLLSAAEIVLIPCLVWLTAEGRPPDASAAPEIAGRAPTLDRVHRALGSTLFITTILSTIATGAVDSWRYFHMVSVVGLAPAAASALLVTAGLLAISGFSLGAIASDRIGRVRSLAGFLIVMCAAIAWAFWGPPAGSPRPWLWLAFGFTTAAIAGNAITVAANTAITELFPASLRATMFGSLFLGGAIGRVAAQGLVAYAAPRLGGVSIAVGTLACFGLPAAALLLWRLPEPRPRIAPVARRAPRASRPARAALTIVGFLVALVALEGAVRLVATHAVMVPWQDDLHGITGPKPEVTGRFAIRQRFDTTITIHQRLRRRRPIALEPPPGTLRIAVLGDSFTFGWGAEDADTYPAVLERRLIGAGAARRPVEVLNAGVINTGTGEQALWYDAWVQQFKPSLVVLTVIWNDVDDDVRAALFERAPDGAIRPRPVEALARGLSTVRTIRALANDAPGFGWLAQHSELLTWLREAPTTWLAAAHARAVGGDAVSGVRRDAVTPEGLALMRGEIRWLRARLTPGSRLAIVFVPSVEAFDPARGGAEAVVHKSAQIAALLGALSREDAIPFLDLGPVFARDRAPERFYFEKDPHPNAAGYAAIGEAVASWLVAQRLVVVS